MVAKGCILTLALLLGLVVGTEVFAYVARLAPQLGMPFYRAGGLALYAPWMLAVWAWQWGDLIPRAFALPVVSVGVTALLVVMPLWPQEPPAPPAQAHWATIKELREAECLSDSGVVLGKVR
jgi:hypothetical protein